MIDLDELASAYELPDFGPVRAVLIEVGKTPRLISVRDPNDLLVRLGGSWNNDPTLALVHYWREARNTRYAVFSDMATCQCVHGPLLAAASFSIVVKFVGDHVRSISLAEMKQLFVPINADLAPSMDRTLKTAAPRKAPVREIKDFSKYVKEHLPKSTPKRKRGGKKAA